MAFHFACFKVALKLNKKLQQYLSLRKNYMSKKAKPKPEVHEYQAEMQKLLEILVHSLYTEREIFLRELVSNASDALSKVQLTTLTEEKVLD